MISVLMFCNTFPPIVGGTEQQMLKLSVALRDQGVGVKVITRRFPGLDRRDTISGLPVQRLGCPSWVRLIGATTFWVALASYLITNRRCYDVLHVHLASPVAAIASALSRWLGRPVVLKIGNSGDRFDLRTMSSRHGGKLAVEVLHRYVNRVVSTTDAIRNELISAGFTGASIESIPNGVGLPEQTRFDLTDEDQGRMRRSLGLPITGHIVLTVGVLSWKKDVKTILRAMEFTGEPETKPPWNLVVVGDGEDRVKLEAQAEKGGIRERIYFVGMSRQINSYYICSDAFVLASQVEGLSNALLEAMSFGLPCVVSDIPANQFLIRNGVNGLTFRTGDTSALAAALTKVLSEKIWADGLGRAARMTVTKRYEIHQVARRYVELYERLLNE